MKTILYIGGFELPDLNPAAHQVVNYGKILKKLGYRVIYSGVNKTVEHGSILKEIIFDSTCYSRSYPSNSFQWIEDALFGKNIKKTLNSIGKIDYIFTYNLHFYQLKRILRFCRKNNIKLILTVSEWYENKISINPIETVKCFDNYFTMNYLNKKADGMIVSSSLLEMYYRNTVRNVIKVPPLVDTKDDKWSLGKKLNSCFSPNIEFIYSGGIEKHGKKDKLCPILVALLNTNRYNFHFKIVGLTKQRLVSEYPEIESIINELGNRITFYGRVSHFDSIKYLYESDFTIFIRDSTRKNNAGFPTKFVESYTSGINLIASNISDISAYIPNNKIYILLESNDVDTISNALTSVLDMDINEIKLKRRSPVEYNPFDYIHWENEIKQFVDTI